MIGNFINKLNTYIKNEREFRNILNKGVLVLHSTIECSPILKVLGTKIYTLYYIEGKNKKELLSVKITGKISDLNVDNSNPKVILKLISFLRDPIFNDIINKEIWK